MITRIRNSNLVRAPFVKVKNTSLTLRIAKLLHREGFVDVINYSYNDLSKDLVLGLKYKVVKNKPYITNIRRVSRSGQRVYCNLKNLPRILGGVGVVVCSFQGIY